LHVGPASLLETKVNGGRRDQGQQILKRLQ
jgi:hypothetical protein